MTGKIIENTKNEKCCYIKSEDGNKLGLSVLVGETRYYWTALPSSIYLTKHLGKDMTK